MAYEISNNGSTSETTTYSYDLNGNLITKSVGVSTTTYTYNVWGNMTSGAGATYSYNAQGLRTSKTVGDETDNFVLIAGNVWSDGETDYLRGIELIASDTNLYLYNIRGDVIQLTDLTGNVVKTYDYDAYGNELQRDLADENPFRYCGEYYDTETGFIYLRARYYDPMVGRFSSVDPVKDGLNWYAYCNCDPVNFVDSNGESTKRKNNSPWLDKKSYVPNGDPIVSFENDIGSYLYVILAKSIFDASDIDTLGELINSYNRIKRVSAKIHYARNRLNAVDLSIEEIVESWDLQSDFANSYHRNVDGNQGHEAKFNKKYLSPDGHYEVIICMPNDVVDEYAYIVDESVDPRNMGTYNFVSNDDPWYWIEHLIFDVMPYNMYGNTPDDTHGNKK